MHEEHKLLFPSGGGGRRMWMQRGRETRAGKGKFYSKNKTSTRKEKCLTRNQQGTKATESPHLPDALVAYMLVRLCAEVN